MVFSEKSKREWELTRNEVEKLPGLIKMFSILVTGVHIIFKTHRT